LTPNGSPKLYEPEVAYVAPDPKDLATFSTHFWKLRGTTFWKDWKRYCSPWIER